MRVVGWLLLLDVQPLLQRFCFFEIHILQLITSFFIFVDPSIFQSKNLVFSTDVIKFMRNFDPSKIFGGVT
ncbi:MAG: hypothetical protein Q9183_007576, partial [Haloplaca sp. 2 TL-2023]